jgi:hypothetical protein
MEDKDVNILSRICVEEDGDALKDKRKRKNPRLKLKQRSLLKRNR